jgi:hypothetical protein
MVDGCLIVVFLKKKNDRCAPNIGTRKIQVWGEQDQPLNGYLFVLTAF